MNKKLFAVTGNPILHSKSPFIFNFLFNKMNIDSNYTRIAAESAKDAIDIFNKMNISGMNVTAPFKKDIMEFLDEIDESAEYIGGVNTVLRQGNKLKGYNTDHYGVSESFINNNIILKEKKAVVIGAGGAGRAAAYGLVKNECDVIIVNRTVEKAKAIAEKLKCQYAGLDELENILKNCDIIVSTLTQNVDVIDIEWLEARHIIFEANYKGSKLIEKGEQQKCRLLKGEEWLVNQAIPSFELFLDIRPPEQVINELSTKILNIKPGKSLFTIILLGANELYEKLAIGLSQELGWNFERFNARNHDRTKYEIDDRSSYILMIDFNSFEQVYDILQRNPQTLNILVLKNDDSLEYTLDKTFYNIDLIINIDEESYNTDFFKLKAEITQNFNIH